MKLVTIASPATHELTIKKSRFVASLLPVVTERCFKASLARIRKEHRGATHHPHAFRIGFEQIHERYADDGEPSRSSGLPILQELEHAHLTNVMLVVTRYFGGTKLGLGGLSRAYRLSAVEVIAAAQTLPVVPVQRFQLKWKQKGAGKMRNLLERLNARIIEETYGEVATFTVEIRKERYASCVETINNLAKGEAIILPLPLADEKHLKGTTEG